MKKVLIAEDNPVNRELLRELLELLGYDVIEATNGEEALEFIREKPELVLLDIGMPGLDGFGAVRKIRELPGLETLPVLAVTAYAMRGDCEKILASGFDGYLSKPIDRVLLQRELDRFIR